MSEDDVFSPKDEENQYSNEIDKNEISPSCYDRWKYELFDRNAGFIELEEKSTMNLKGSSYIDVEKTFAPRKLYAVPRALVLAVNLAILVVDLLHDDYGGHHYLFFAYLTHWAWLFTIFYQITSLYVTINRKTLAQPKQGDSPCMAVVLMWYLYSLSCPLNVFVVLMFWPLVFPSYNNFTFLTLYKHGITCLFLFIDGHILSKIPLRMKQLIPLLILGLCYLIWTIIHGLALNIGDGINKDAPLYTMVNWKKSPLKAAIVSVIFLFVGFPVIYTLLWTSSRMSKCCKFDANHRPIFQSNDESISNTTQQVDPKK